jgi:hypothetical protein
MSTIIAKDTDGSIQSLSFTGDDIWRVTLTLRTVATNIHQNLGKLERGEIPDVREEQKDDLARHMAKDLIGYLEILTKIHASGDESLVWPLLYNPAEDLKNIKSKYNL